MKYPTLWVRPDEPCHGLAEMPRMVNGEWRWIQAVYVVRDDTIAEWTHDYGPADIFRTQPLLMPGFGDDTVAQMQEWADKHRQDDYWTRRGEEMLAGSTLISDHADQVEKDRLEIRNRSVFGPSQSVQRFGYSQEHTRRKIKELKHGR